MVRLSVWMLLAAMVAGCGAAAPENSQAAVSAGSVLVAIRVLPDTVTVSPGDNQAFTATGYYADGTSRPVFVAWTSSDVAVATADHGGIATAIAAGTATITARAFENPAVTGVATLEVAAGPVLGASSLVAHDSALGFVKYDAAGGVTTIAPYANAASVAGFQMVGSDIYFIEGTDLHRIDIPTGAESLVGTIPGAVTPRGLVASGSGLMYTTDRNGTIIEIIPTDPPTSRLMALGSRVTFAAIAIAPNGTIYAAVDVVYPGGVWVYSVDAAGNFQAWIGGPDSPSLSASYATGGLAVADDGTVLVADARDGGRVYAGLDLDGDGYCNPFSPDGEVVAITGLHGQIQGIAIDSNNTVYINDPVLGGIFVIDPVSGTETLFSGQVADVGTDMGGIKRAPAAP